MFKTTILPADPIIYSNATLIRYRQALKHERELPAFLYEACVQRSTGSRSVENWRSLFFCR